MGYVFWIITSSIRFKEVAKWRDPRREPWGTPGVTGNLCKAWPPRILDFDLIELVKHKNYDLKYTERCQYTNFKMYQPMKLKMMVLDELIDLGPGETRKRCGNIFSVQCFPNVA